MGIEISGSFDFAAFSARLVRAIPEAEKAGLEPVLERAVEKVPKAPKKPTDNLPHLAESGHIMLGPNGHYGVKFDGPYAAYIHENIGFHHVHGGQSKYLETALTEETDEALRRAAESIQESL